MAPGRRVLASAAMPRNTALKEYAPRAAGGARRAQCRAGRADGRRKDLDRPPTRGATRAAVLRRGHRDRGCGRLLHCRNFHPLRRAGVPGGRAAGDRAPARRRTARARDRRRRLYGPGDARRDPRRGGLRVAAVHAAHAAAPSCGAEPPPAAERGRPGGDPRAPDGRPPSRLCRGRRDRRLRRGDPRRDHIARARRPCRLAAAAAARRAARRAVLRDRRRRGAAAPRRRPARPGAAAEARLRRHRRDRGPAAPAGAARRPRGDGDRGHAAARPGRASPRSRCRCWRT